jgi:tungstate transport system ATP-binding protein
MSMREPASALPILFSGVAIRAGDTTLLRDVSLTLSEGPPTLLIGPNGAGKTTFLRAAMGLIAPTRGEISWGGSRHPPAIRLAIVFQRPVMLRRSCAANLRYALAAAGVVRSERDRRTAELLQLVGLEALAQRPARRLSGGEQQRLALARALARKPTVLFLDEPTASLDPAATKTIEDIVRSVSLTGVKVVMATHDLGEARRLAGEIILLHRGAIVESQPAQRFFADPLTDAGKRFIAGELLT